MAQRSPASELRSHLFLQLINYFLKQIVIKIQVAQGSDGVTIPGKCSKNHANVSLNDMVSGELNGAQLEFVILEAFSKIN